MFPIPAIIVGLILLSSCQKKDTLTGDINLPQQEKFAYKILNKTIDSLQYNNPLSLDLNQDNEDDYFLTSLLIEENDDPYLYLLINARSVTGNKVLIKNGPELVGNAGWCVPLEENDLIGDTPATGFNWTANLTKGYFLGVKYTNDSRTFLGDWIGKKDKYLGLKFKINGMYHYGWIRISHQENQEKLLIADYAYHRESGKSIRAGQKM